MVAVLDCPRARTNETESLMLARLQPASASGSSQDTSAIPNRHRAEAWAPPVRFLVASVIVVAMAWLTISTAMTMASWAVGIGEPTFDNTDAPIIHLVEPGDTVWSVARLYQPSGDVRPFVDRLLELNGGSNITIGQRLLVSP